MVFWITYCKNYFFLPFLLKLFWGSSTTKPKLRGSCNIFLRVNFLSNHWLCSAILLATTNWERYKEKEKDKERKLRKLHCTNSCFFAKIDIFKLFAVHVSFILSLGTGTYGDVGMSNKFWRNILFFTFTFLLSWPWIFLYFHELRSTTSWKSFVCNQNFYPNPF